MTLQLLLENVVKHNKLTKARPILVTCLPTKAINFVLKYSQHKRNSRGLCDWTINLKMRLALLAKQELNVQETDQFFTVQLPAL